MQRTLISCLLITISLSFIITPNAVYTTFVGYYPDENLSGQKIYIRGDGCNLTWTKGVPLNKTGANEWKTALMCAQNTVISVKLLLNDTNWMFGGNTAFNGGQRTIQIFPSFHPTANKIIDKSNIVSKILGNTRKCSLYYPPSYFDNPFKKYQVLFMHDGQNLFNNSQAAFGTAWLIQNTINQMVSEGKMREIIVVGIWNTVDRNNQYTYSYDPSEKFGGKGEKYLDFIEQQLTPIVEGDWFKGRIQGSYGIGGSSLGGLISCYATYTRPTKFPKGVCMSSSFWWNTQDFNTKIIATQKLYQNVQFYIDSGDSGPSQDGKNQTVTVYNHLKSIGYTANKTLFYYLDKGGQHSEAYWGKRFAIPMVDLYPA